MPTILLEELDRSDAQLRKHMMEMREALDRDARLRCIRQLRELGWYWPLVALEGMPTAIYRHLLIEAYEQRRARPEP